MKTVKLSQFLRHPTALLRRMAGSGVDVDIVTPGDLWDVSVDPERLEDALQGLFLNACDAMPSGGRLTIAARNERLDGDGGQAAQGFTNGEHVRLDITDTGAGVPPGITDEVLNSFPTTLQSASTSGSGLYAAHEFVTQSGGRMTIDSEAGRGTRVSLLFPRASIGSLGVERPLPVELPQQQGHNRCS